MNPTFSQSFTPDCCWEHLAKFTVTKMFPQTLAAIKIGFSSICFRDAHERIRVSRLRGLRYPKMLERVVWS